MLDPAREECDLHIGAASIFFMQLELLEAQRFIALCHNEGTILDEERILATTSTSLLAYQPGLAPDLRAFFAFAVVPKAQSRARARHAATADDHSNEVAKNLVG